MKIIGTAIFLIKNNQFAISLRKNTNHFCDYYGIPGGKVENNETFKKCIIRETYEETGVKLNSDEVFELEDPKFYNKPFDSNDEITCQWFYAFIKELPKTNIENREWHWVSFNNPPQKLMPGTKEMLEKVKKYI